MALYAPACSVGADLQTDHREQQLQAAYLFHIAAFVAWPSLTPADTLNVCFIGGADVRDALGEIASGKLSGTHPVAIRSIGSLRGVAGCHVVYLDAASPLMKEYRGEANPDAVLTVSDQSGFIHHGGIVEFFTVDNRLRFNINLGNARYVNLKISSNLLQLASHVEEARQ